MKAYEKFRSRYSDVAGNCYQFLIIIYYDYIIIVQLIYISSNVLTEIYFR